MSVHARRFSNGLHGRSPNISPRPANSLSANLPLRFGSFSKMSQILSIVALISPDWLFSSKFCVQFKSGPSASSLSDTCANWLKSLTAESARSFASCRETRVSAMARLRIAVYDGSRLVGVFGSALSSKSPNLCSRTRSKAFTSRPQHGSVE